MKFAILTLLLVLAGCSERTAIVRRQATLVEAEGRLSVGSGSNVVLEYEKSFFLPLPDVFSSEGVYLEVEGSRLVKGAVLSIPSDVVRCYQWKTKGPRRKASEDCAGTLTVKSVSEDAVRARLDVDSEALDLRFRRRVKFKKPPERPPENEAPATSEESSTAGGSVRVARGAK